MKKRIVPIILLLMISASAHANWMRDIFSALLAMQGMQVGMLSQEGQMLAVQRDILSTQKDIDSLMRQVNGHLTGHSGWGNFQVRDYQSFGDAARDWAGVMRMAEAGRGAGALGEIMGGLARQFPENRTIYNRGVSDRLSQKYYALRSQTILAARAASQLDYSRIEEQIACQKMLQQQIENTSDLKSAVDLLNRIQVEGNLISLQVLRQAALANQQQAIADQSAVNAALANARFLTK